MTVSTPKTHCGICPDGSDAARRIDPKDTARNTTLIPILDLGVTPLADRFVTNPNDDEPTAPLRVGYCPHCKSLQLMDLVQDDLLYGNDYAFFTGASPSSIRYFEEYAKDCLKRFPKESKKVLEIASNDGTLLKHFKDAGSTVLGIDPATSTAYEAKQNGVPTIGKPFSLNESRFIEKDHGRFSLILANNVLAHVQSPQDFIAGVTRLLTDDGLFIAEVQYLPRMFFPNAFDHIYHEHRYYYSLHSLKWLFRFHFLRIVDVMEADTQGGSIRVFVRHDPYHTLPVSDRVTALLELEKAAGITDVETFRNFPQRIDYTRRSLVSLLERLRQEGKTIYGYGASAKGNTLLNTCGITTDLLDCIVDLTPWKIGTFTPGTHIPVVRPQDRPAPDYYLILAHNYLKGILEREAPYRQQTGGRFIVPIPVPFIL